MQDVHLAIAGPLATADWAPPRPPATIGVGVHGGRRATVGGDYRSSIPGRGKASRPASRGWEWAEASAAGFSPRAAPAAVDGLHRAPDRTEAAGVVWSAVRHRQPLRRGQRRRCGTGQAGARRRLHAAGRRSPTRDEHVLRSDHGRRRQPGRRAGAEGIPVAVRNNLRDALVTALDDPSVKPSCSRPASRSRATPPVNSPNSALHRRAVF